MIVTKYENWKKDSYCTSITDHKAKMWMGSTDRKQDTQQGVSEAELHAAKLKDGERASCPITNVTENLKLLVV